MAIAKMKTKQEGLNVSIADIRDAGEELATYLSPTPLLLNRWLSEAYGCQVFLKLENMQPIGSFKIRGATYKILRLTPDEKKRGVVAASAGNHAQGVAWGSQQMGVHAVIVMPKSAALVKIQNTRALGAEVILHGDNFDEAHSYARTLCQESGKTFLPAFEDEKVIAGQGTVGLELFEQRPDLDYVLSSVGGGGLMAGIAIAGKALSPKTKMIGCQAERSASMIESIEKGSAVTLKTSNTFADGIAVIKASENMRRILASTVDQWVGVSEEAIAGAILTLLEKAKTVAEGAGACALAGLDKIKDQVKGKKVAVVVSGGNIDVNVLSRVIDVGLVRAGRRVRVNVQISDRPGSLARLTDLIAKQEANVLQAIHDRNEPSTKIDETDVALTLETRGPEHSASLIELLRKNVLRLELVH